MSYAVVLPLLAQPIITYSLIMRSQIPITLTFCINSVTNSKCHDII